MERQLSFAQAEYAQKKKTTRRDKFLAEMEQVVPWARLVALIEPHYPKGERGRPPLGVERMLRVYFLAQWYGLADEALEDTICDSQAMRGFVGVDLGVEGVPDATTLLGFRHLLERHELTRGLLDEVNAHLIGLYLRQLGHDCVRVANGQTFENNVFVNHVTTNPFFTLSSAG